MFIPEARASPPSPTPKPTPVWGAPDEDWNEKISMFERLAKEELDVDVKVITLQGRRLSSSL